MYGSLQTKNGRFYMVLELGKHKQKWIATGLPVAGNKRKAEKMLRDTIREYEEKLAAIPDNDMPFTELIREWLKVKQKEIRRNTYTAYEETANLHIIPYFDGCMAGSITTVQIKRYYTEKAATGLTRGTLERHRTILRGALGYAVETLGLFSVNAADAARLPKNVDKKLPTYYTPEQIKVLFSIVEGESIEAPVRLAATYGLRRSEAIGLKWSAVDFRRKTIRIQHTILRDGSEVIEADTVKENASYRTMPLTKDMEVFLRNLKSRQKQNKKLCGKDYTDSDYICVWDDGRLLEPDYVTSRFSRFLDGKGLPHIRFHDLRHSSASLLVNAGFTLEEVKTWLGHASIRSTERYAHLQAGNKNEMAGMVEKLLSQAG